MSQPTQISDVLPSDGYFYQYQQSAQIKYGGKLYAFFALSVGGFYQATVWSTSDGGVTWSRLDATHEPITSAITAADFYNVFDGNHTLTVLTPNYTGSPNPPNAFFTDFDLSTNTWGSAYGGGLSIEQVQGLFRRSNGDLLVVFFDSTVLTSPGLGLYVYSAGVWSAPIDLGASIRALPNYANTNTGGDSYNPGVMDSNDVLHLWIGVGYDPAHPVINWYSRFFYLQIDSNNSLSNFYDYPSQIGGGLNLPNGAIQAFTGAVIVGTDVVATIVRLVDPPDGNVYVTVALGTPIASPVWQLLGAPGVDSASYDLISPGQPNIMTDGTTIYIWWIQTDDPTFTYSYNQIRLTQTLGATPLTGWSASTYFDFLTDPAPAGFLQPGQAMRNAELSIGSILSSFTALDLTGTDITRYMIGTVSPPPPPLVPLSGLKILLRGVKRFKREAEPETCECPEGEHVKRAV